MNGVGPPEDLAYPEIAPFLSFYNLIPIAIGSNPSIFPEASFDQNIKFLAEREY